MNERGESFMRKAMRAMGVVSPSQLCSGQLFAIVPGAAVIPSVPMAFGGLERDGDERKPYAVKDGIAQINITGPLSKHPDIFQLMGCSESATMPQLAQAVRQAVEDGDVRGLMLVLDSPGGTVAGTFELATAIRKAGELMPVHAFVQDQCGSAAYWVASQAQRLTVNATGSVGSIGVYAVLADSSAAADRAGLKFHLVSTGAHKGAGHPGLPITDEQLAAWQAEIDDVNGVFLSGVASGRGLSLETVTALADGRSHVGETSARLGLTDGVDTLEGAMAALAEAIRQPMQAATLPTAAPQLAAKTAQGGSMKKKATAPRRGMSVANFLAKAFGMKAEEVETQWEVLSGTVSVDAGSAEVMGSGTKFTEELAVSDIVSIAGEEFDVMAVDSDESATLSGGHSSGATDAAISRLVPVEVPEETPAEEAAPETEEPSARVAALEKAVVNLTVQNALAPYRGKVSRGRLAAIERTMTRAAFDGRTQDYADALQSLEGIDESELLGNGNLAGPAAGAARTVPKLSSQEVEYLVARGVTAERATNLTRKYLSKKVN